MLARTLALTTGLCLSFVVTVPLASQSPAVAYEQFQRDIGGPWIVQWHPPTGTPQAIFGHGYPLTDWRENSLIEARRHANTQMQRWSPLLGLGASDWRESIGARMGRTWTFTFEQWFRGVPVIGGRADVRIHMTGRVCHLGSTAWPVPADFDLTPKLDEQHAIANAWLALGREGNSTPQPGQPRAPRLVIWGDAAAAGRTPFTLAWEVPISAVDAAGNGPIGRAYIHAQTGASLHWTNDKHECGVPACTGERHPKAPVPATYTVRAWTHTAFSPASTPTNATLAGVEILVPGVGTVITDQNGQFTVDLTVPTQVVVSLRGEHTSLVAGANALNLTATLQPGVNSTLQLGTAAATEQQLAHTTTYYWTDRINTWARGILGNSPELAVADNVFPTVNINSSCNAYYTGNSINFYASGGGCNNTAAASVVAHEWGHGLDDRYGGISQTNGLSEGWGDTCSMYLLDDPTIGHDFFSGGGGIRSGTNNQQYPNGGGPHDQGLSWMGFAWKFRENLRAVMGTTVARQISDDVVLGSIAANAFNQPDAVVAAFQADDDDGLLGNGTPHYANLVSACQLHNLPYPPLLAGYIEHTQLTNTTAQLTPRRIEVNAVPITGSYSQVRVHWGPGANQRILVPTGTTNRWHALLPGQLAPQIVQYHIEAQHIGGALHRLPLVGEYLYMTVGEHRIWFDDFEAGAVGWTHGATSGTDDWQLGTPVNHPGWWTDPTAAASGQNCFGNNLGATSNGAYAPASDSWLRSPPIDCTGLTGVRLRFKRWASCAGPTDRLELRVAGTLSWATSFAPMADSGWFVHDALVSLANNQPNVVIEFRLVSTGQQQYGGWNIDDFELYSLAYASPPPATLTLLPEQASQGAPITLAVGTLPTKPFLLVLGDTTGPTTIPGFPTLQVGGNLATLFGVTDASGQFTATFAAPPSPLIGASFWSQFLTLDGASAVIASNTFRNLFTQ